MVINYDSFPIYKKLDPNLQRKLLYKNDSPNVLYQIFKPFYKIQYIRPATIRIETVNKCNYSCIFCGKNVMTRNKEIMSLELFTKIISDYCDMGGGHISLTPQVGEIFLDPLLTERINVIKKFPKISSTSVTTNAVNTINIPDSELLEIISNLNRVHISIYGLDESEHKSIVGVDDYYKVIEAVKRLYSFDNKKVVLGIRSINHHSEQFIKNWIETNFNALIPYGHTIQYATMGGSLDITETLPCDARWADLKEKNDVCISPIFGLRIFSNGAVSFCCAGDPDNSREFDLGNIKNSSLSSIYHSNKVRTLQLNKSSRCKKCNYYRPLNEVRDNLENWIENPIDFIGG
jgi:MoaA/NifB/PqqE/SkfB family radical SAM enzyme